MVMESFKYSQELNNKLTSLSLLLKLNIYCEMNHFGNQFEVVVIEKPKILPRIDHNLLKKENKFQGLKDGEVLVYTDEASLNYLVLKLSNPEKGATVIIGPYFYETPSLTFIEDYLLRKHIPKEDLHLLVNYFSSIQVLDAHSIRSITQVLITFMGNPLNTPELQRAKANTLISLDDEGYNELDNDSSYVNRCYAQRNELLHFVEAGRPDEALQILSDMIKEGEERSTTPFRILKNRSFALNTMLCMAAEKGGVSPYQLHTKSTKFTTLIENHTTIQSILQIQKDMVASFSKLVNRCATKGLSKPIMAAVHYIDNHLPMKISLLDISQYANINGSHLSRQFKKETGSTVTEYINKKRILTAKFYLENTNHSITVISTLCGFENHNYFSKVFKEETKLTPREYQKNIFPKEKSF